MLTQAAVARDRGGELRTSSAVDFEFPNSAPATIHCVIFQEENRRKLMRENQTTTIWGNAHNQMGQPSSCWTWGRTTGSQHVSQPSRETRKGVQRLNYRALISKCRRIILKRVLNFRKQRRKKGKITRGLHETPPLPLQHACSK